MIGFEDLGETTSGVRENSNIKTIVCRIDAKEYQG